MDKYPLGVISYEEHVGIFFKKVSVFGILLIASPQGGRALKNFRKDHVDKKVVNSKFLPPEF
jgi:hypothetical protein